MDYEKENSCLANADTLRCLLDRLKPVCPLGCHLSKFQISAFHRMLHNLLAHNSPSGMEQEPARGRSKLQAGGQGPAALPLSGFCVSCFAMLEHTTHRRCLLFKVCVSQEQKINHCKVRSRAGENEARCLQGLDTRDSAWAVQGELIPSSAPGLHDWYCSFPTPLAN